VSLFASRSAGASLAMRKLKYMRINGILWCIENYTVVLTFRNS